MRKQVWSPPQHLKLDRVPRNDLVGREFGRLHVVSYAGYTVRQGQPGRDWWWWCTCSCDGHQKYVKKMDRNLKGVTKSCGCLNREQSRKGGPRQPPLYRRGPSKNAEMPWDVRVRLQSASFEQALQKYADARISL